MEEETKAPFEDIVSSLFAEEIGPINLLYRLSDMNNEELAQFHSRLSAATDDRRKEIVRHLADISEQNFIVDYSPIFRLSFQDPFAPVRAAALDGLWDSTDPTLVDPILSLLTNDPALEVRVAAARSLAHFLMMSEWDQIRGIDTLQIFKSLLVVYEDPRTELSLKCAALEAMSPLSVPDAFRLIEDAYEGYVPELQMSALFSMGNSADPRWLSILIDEMESPEAEMRAEAARAAGLIGRSEAIPQLAELAVDEDDDVAKAAVTALSLIGGEETDHILEGLLTDPHSSHLHEVIEAVIEESNGLERGLPLIPWSDDDIDRAVTAEPP